MIWRRFVVHDERTVSISGRIEYVVLVLILSLLLFLSLFSRYCCILGPKAARHKVEDMLW